MFSPTAVVSPKFDSLCRRSASMAEIAKMNEMAVTSKRRKIL
jgi:hypothetical protein